MRNTALAIIILLFSGSAFADSLKVATLNIGLAQGFGFELVPCLNARRPTQIKEIKKFIKNNDNYVLFLQEVWEKSYYNDFKALADKEGHSISTSKVANQGLVILTNGKISNEKFHAYSCDNDSQARGVLAVDIKLGKKTIKAFDVHTAYSKKEKPDTCHEKQLKETAKVVSSIKKGTLGIMAGDFNLGYNLRLKDQQYDPVKKIWEPFLKNLGKSWSYVANKELTWDENSNIFVENPAGAIKFVGGWPEEPSTVDNIFVTASHENRVKNIGLIFDKPVATPGCTHKDSNGLLPQSGYPLSDHYGVTATIELN